MSFFDEAYWAGFGPDDAPGAGLGYDDAWGYHFFNNFNNEEVDLAIDFHDAGHNAGRGSLGGSSNDRTSSISSGVSNAHNHHYSQPSFAPRYPSIKDYRGNFEIPPGTAPGDESHFDQDQVASLEDDMNTGLDSLNRGRFIGVDNTSHHLTTVDTSITTLPQGTFSADGPGSFSGGYVAPSNSIDGAVETNNSFTLDEAINRNIPLTVNPAMITNTDTTLKRHEASNLDEALNTGDNTYLHGADKAKPGKDHSELSIRPDRDISELNSGSLVRARSFEPDNSASTKDFDMPIASQLPYSSMEMISSNQEDGSETQGSLELSERAVNVASNNSQRHGLPLRVSDLSTTESPTFTTSDDTDAPVFTSYADVELVMPTLRKPISPVQPGVSKCLKCLKNRASQMMEALVSWRLQRGLYSCTGCYVGAGPTPNVLDEMCRDKQRERRRRLAAEANGETYIPGGGQDTEAGIVASDAQSTASLPSKRGASAMAGGSDVAEGTAKKARITKEEVDKTVDQIRRPASPKRRMQGLGQPPARA
ncbi:hypothetical protein QR685DRAFT_436898 [Neurospora intermedia]|uniref:GATA-type domain-containing protein n=1 Tax=Neurospora intermedia TaxID=5142 RepID=A0ABR3DJI7_NEUIN